MEADMAADLGKMMADYIKEKQDGDTVTSDHGFVIYQLKGQGILHINNIYVKPEYRKTKQASKMMDKVIDEVAKKHKCDLITASCDHAQLRPETSMMSILSYKHKDGHRFKIMPENIQTNFVMELNNGN